VVFSIARQKGAGRREGSPSKIESNWGKHSAVAADLVKNDRQIASRMITESLNISKTVVLRILKEDFCSRDFSCCKIMHRPTKLQVFANF
jgi:hypothetical protein